MLQHQQSTSRRAARRSFVFPLNNLRKPVLFEGTSRAMFAGMIVDAAKPLAGRGQAMQRGPLELCPWDGKWRQFFMAGNLLIEFFWDERPTGPRFRGDYYFRNPDHIIVSRGSHLGPSDEELMPESMVLQIIERMIIPA